MKVKLCYEAARIIEIEVDDKYKPCIETEYGDEKWTSKMDRDFDDLVAYCDKYAAEHDPDFAHSNALLNENDKCVGEW